MESNLNINYNLRTFRGDLFGGLTATFVCLPIAIAFGVTSGLGAAAGVYGAIGAGFFAAIFGGTNAQITKPTAPMTIAMAVILTTHAQSVSEAFTIVIMAGVLQVILGLIRIGRFVTYTPYVVVSGFMSGIGVIVMCLQLPTFFGLSIESKSIGESLLYLSQSLDQASWACIIVGGITLVIAFGWPERWGRFFPGTLLALIVGSVIGIVFFGGIPAVGEVPQGLPDFNLSLPSFEFVLRALEPALIVALLGSVDSLLTALVADTMTSTAHKPDRELLGQGLGNIVAGLISGLPCAGSTAGTVTNIRAGGRTRVSGVIYALALLALILGLGTYVEPIPLAVLAAVLIRVGWGIVDWPLVRRIHRLRKDHLLIMLLTFGITVFVDLITAVAIGLIAGAIAHSRRLERLELDSVVSAPLLDHTFLNQEESSSDEADLFKATVGLVSFQGQFTVASAHKLVKGISYDIEGHQVVIFDFSKTTYLDDSSAMLIRRLLNIVMDESKEYIVMGLTGQAKNTLESLNILHNVPSECIVDSLDDARVVAKSLLSVRDQEHQPANMDA